MWFTRVIGAIIDDESSFVSVSFRFILRNNTSDTAIASGDLKLITKGYMNLTELFINPQKQKFQKVIWLLHQAIKIRKNGNKFLPGIPVGYVTKTKKDAKCQMKNGFK